MNDHRTITTARSLAALLRVEFPDAEDAIADTIDGELDLTTALYRILVSAEENRTDAAAIAIRVHELEERKARFEATMEKKRALVLRTMEECGVTSFKRPEMSVNVVASQAKVIVTDETKLPPACVRVYREPMKAEIAKALKAGEVVAGATLGNPGTHLVIRRS